MFEAISCSIRTSRKSKKILLANTLFSDDLEVLRTLANETGIEFLFVELDESTGLIDYDSLLKIESDTTDEISAFVYPQVNAFGLLENVDLLTDFCTDRGIRSIATIDPFLLASGGLKPPVSFGNHGADFIVGDAQHLATRPSFGGPGLGLFGCRYNEKTEKTFAIHPTLHR